MYKKYHRLRCCSLASLLFLVLLVLSGWLHHPPVSASAEETPLKTYQTQTKIFYADLSEADEYELEFRMTQDFSSGLNFPFNSYRVDIKAVPTYHSIRADGIDYTNKNSVKKQITANTTIYSPFEDLTPERDANGGASYLFSSSSDLYASNLEFANDFTVSLPDTWDLSSIFSEDASVIVRVSYKVTVKIYLESGSIPKVKLKKNRLSLYPGDEVFISDLASTEKESQDMYTGSSGITTKSDHPEIVSVSSLKLIAKKPGSCTITFQNKYGSKVSMKCTVKASSVERIVSSISCVKGSKTSIYHVINAYGRPKFTVTSSNPSVAKVSKENGIYYIHALKSGSSSLTVKCGSKKFSIRVRVNAGTARLVKKISIEKGQTALLTCENSSSGIVITKIVSSYGYVKPKILADGRNASLTARNFSGKTVKDKLTVYFNSGAKKTVSVTLTKPKTTKKKFSLSDVLVIPVKSVYYPSTRKNKLTFQVANYSSKSLKQIRIRYTGMADETVTGVLKTLDPVKRGQIVTFTATVITESPLEHITYKVLSAS